jgi:hypothetical protein
MTGSKPAKEPKRRRPIHDKLLTAEQRVDTVVKIVGTQHRALVEWALATTGRVVEDIHSERVSKKWRIKRPAKEFESATQRMVDLVKKAPQQWFDFASTDREHLLRQLKNLLAVCITIRVGFDRLKPKPSADDRSESAIAALWICGRTGIKPIFARGSKYYRIAAALYGDPKADLDYHCRKAPNLLLLEP